MRVTLADNLRRHFPVVRHTAYLATSVRGAVPDLALEAMQKALAWEAEFGGGHPEYAQRLQQARARVREHLAALLCTRPDRIALTDGAAHAVQLVLHGLPLWPGDEVVVSDDVDAAVWLAVHLQRQRRGIVVRVVDGRLAPDDLVAAVNAMTGPRTRLVVTAHVSPATGQRQPVERLCEVAHAKQAFLLVDGRQGAGVDAVDVEAAGIDFYAVDGGTWLCGPEGVGALYVRRDAWSVLEPAFAGPSALAAPGAVQPYGGFWLAPNAARFDCAHAGLAAWTGWAEALRFLRAEAGWDFIRTRVRGLSGYLLDRLLSMDGVRVWTPREGRAGLVVFQTARLAPDAVAAACAARDVRVEVLPDAVRAATAMYNQEADIDRLVQALAEAGSLRGRDSASLHGHDGAAAAGAAAAGTAAAGTEAAHDLSSGARPGR